MSKDDAVTTATSTPAAPATEFAVSHDGTRIAFERSGSGPVLVLVDGALCSRDFGPARPMAAELGDSFTVVSYDRRGRGESGHSSNDTPEREFDDLKAVMDAVAGEYVFGQSSGAGLAYRATAAGLITPRKLAGYEAPWVGLRRNRDGSLRDYQAELEALLAKGDNGGAVGYFMVKMVKGPWFLPLMMRMMGKVWGQLKAVAPTLPNDARMMGAQFTVPTDELAKISVPTLVMVGSKSPADMTAAQRTIADTISGAEYRVLAGQTHQVSPKALRPELIGFFA
jgi:pimeloyl-ACP methyl ester carboxylesterase